MTEKLFSTHSDSIDRQQLLCVPTDPVTPEDKAKVYRPFQFLHPVSNFGDIVRERPRKNWYRIERGR